MKPLDFDIYSFYNNLKSPNTTSCQIEGPAVENSMWCLTCILWHVRVRGHSRCPGEPEKPEPEKPEKRPEGHM